MKTILIIEDNRVNMMLTTVVLEKGGYAVMQADNAVDGLRLARAHMPDAILLDIQMPGLDGFAVLDALKSDPRTAGIRVIALTALAMAGDEQRIRAAGCDDYIAKPFHYRTFLDKISAATQPPLAIAV